MNGRAQRLDAEAASALAQRSQHAFGVFAAIFARSLKRDFHSVRLSRAGPPPAPNMPRLVVFTNHPAWWDAAVYAVLARRLFPDRAGYAFIDAAMLQRYRFMRHIGGIGIEQGSRRGAAFFLAAAARALASPDGMLFVAAQGRFADARERPTQLAPGLAHLIDGASDINFVPLALDYTFWNERRPELLLRFGAALSSAALLAQSVKNRNAWLGAHLEAVQDALAIEAIRRDPAAFDTIIEGRVGIGGVYDLWRRSRAALTGGRFSAAHGDHP